MIGAQSWGVDMRIDARKDWGMEPLFGTVITLRSWSPSQFEDTGVTSALLTTPCKVCLE